MTTFLFLRITHDLPGLPLVAVTRGEPRNRPFVPIPFSVPPACAGLPDFDTEPTATPRVTQRARVAPRSNPREFSAD